MVSMNAPERKKFTDYRVMYRLEEGGPQHNIGRISCDSLETLHRAMVNITNKKKPMADWHEFYAHANVDGEVKEYGKLFLGALYDSNYTFGDKAVEEETIPFLFSKGLTPSVRTIDMSRKDSVFLSSFIHYGGM